MCHIPSVTCVPVTKVPCVVGNEAVGIVAFIGKMNFISCFWIRRRKGEICHRRDIFDSHVYSCNVCQAVVVRNGKRNCIISVVGICMCHISSVTCVPVSEVPCVVGNEAVGIITRTCVEIYDVNVTRLLWCP